MTRIVFLVLVVIALTMLLSVPAHADGPTLADAQRAFFNARYQAAADLALALQVSDASGLAAHEVRASALHFLLRDALGDHGDKGKAFKQCLACPDLLTAFLSGTTQGQIIARGRLRMNPSDAEALFFLGKLNLIYVWLHVETLGRKTGWNGYWEARRSLDAVLKDNPQHSAGSCRESLDRLHRRHKNGKRHALAARRGKQEARVYRRARSRKRRVRVLRPCGSGVRALGDAGP